MVKLRDNHSLNYPLLIIILALLSFGRSMLLHDVIWDDNCWLLSYYFTDNLHDFMDTGFTQLRRTLLGTFMYYYYSIHKSTDTAYLIWNSFNLLVQILSPLYLYFFINNIFKKSRLFAFFAACTFIVCLLDNTLPYYISITYRLGALFSIISFYLTERALAGKTRWGLVFIATALSAFSSCVLMESTVALEPARLFLIWHLLSKKHHDKKIRLAATLKVWLPFILSIAPIMYYKLAFKPYGVYGGMYSIDPLFFLNFRLHAKVIRHLMFYNWYELLTLSGNANIWSVALGATATVTAFFIVKKIRHCYPERSGQQSAFDTSTFKEAFMDVRVPFILSLLLILPVVSMYELAGRSPAPGMEGRHATVLLFGFGMFFGSLLYCVYMAAAASATGRRWIAIFLVIFLGAGTFFNNMNLDVYFTAQGYQRNFWKAFTERFPTLPEKATFLFDVRGDDRFYYYADLEAYYELELPLNMLYARSTDSDKFLNYRVYAVSEGIKDEWKKHDSLIFQRHSHAGLDTFNTDEMIFIYYRGGEILVNREIPAKSPDVPYKVWLDKDPPQLSGTMPEYPLRYKFKGFY